MHDFSSKPPEVTRRRAVGRFPRGAAAVTLVLLAGAGVACSLTPWTVNSAAAASQATSGATSGGAGPTSGATSGGGASGGVELAARLGDAKLSLEDRRAAAGTLLDLKTHEAMDALAAALDAKAEAGRRQAVLGALVARAGPPPRRLLSPLLALVSHSEDATSDALAALLGRVDTPEVDGRLLDVARDAKAPLKARLTAIAALSRRHSRRMVGRMLGLTAASQPEAVQQAAFAALRAMTGLDRLDDDRVAWLTWWHRARKLDDDAWRDGLLHNFAAAARRRQQREQRLEARVVEAQRNVYRAASTDDRPAVLIKILNDPVAAVRALGLDLAAQRLVDDHGFSNPLRAALRQRLNDSALRVRQRATLLLRDLADGPAADAVAKRLAGGVEHVTSVRRADLLLLARLPREAAVPSMLAMLDDPEWRRDAAGALAAAADAHLLTPAQQRAAAQAVRTALDAVADPAPESIALLGKVAEARDWRQIEHWLDSKNVAVRQAAARAWADSTQPLAALVARVNDPVMEAALVRAAAQRGQSPRTLLVLVAHPPKEGNSPVNWQRALIAMAGRVPPRAVLQAVAQLMPASKGTAGASGITSGASRGGLPGGMLSAALHDGQANQPKVNQADAIALLIARAAVRLAASQPEKAVVDYDRIAALKAALSAGQHHAIDAGRIQAALMKRDLAGALALARQFRDQAAAHAATQPGQPGAGLPGAGDGAATQPVEVVSAIATQPAVTPFAKVFLAAANRALAQGQRKDAAAILAGLHQLLGPAVPDAVRTQIAAFQVKLHPPSTQPTTSPHALAGGSTAHAATQPAGDSKP